MYSRQLTECPEKFVKNGKPVFGTFFGLPKKLDIRWVRHPYANMPLPAFITNIRIKSRLSFFFTIGNYLGCIEFFDAKILGLAEVYIWEKDSAKQFVYRSLMGPRKRFVPHKLDSASTSCYRKSRYIRISWDRKHDKLSVIFNLKGNAALPDATTALIARFGNTQMQMTSVQPSPTLRRCSAKYYLTLPLHGSLTLSKVHSVAEPMPDADGICFFDMNRTYMRFSTSGIYCTLLGNIDGEILSLRLESSSQEAVDPDKYNGNALFYKNTVTALPPVLITHPFGITKKWIIQDTENMIDLTFTPLSDNIQRIDAFLLRTKYHNVYGTFDGVLLTAGGEKITVKSLPGLSKVYSIRL